MAEVAREFGVGWETVMRAVRDEAATRFADGGIYTVQSRPCLALGVDEKVMNRASPRRRRRYVTVLVDLGRGVPIDIVEGRSKRVLRAWLAAQPLWWRAGVRIATLDPAAPYRAALTDPQVGLPHARLVLDHFHAQKLANAAIDDVRRRVQNETLGHRGRKHDPLYYADVGISSTESESSCSSASSGSTTGHTAASATARTKGDPWFEVECAWAGQQMLRDVYRADTPNEASARLDEFLARADEVDIPELSRLAGNVRRWRIRILAYHTRQLSNGPTEAMILLVKRVKRNRVRIPQLPQLPQLSPPTTVALRRQMEHAAHHQNQRPHPSSLAA